VTAIKYAPAWKRLLAYVIDGVLTTLIPATILVTIGFPEEVYDFLIFGIFMGYNILMEYYFQATLGKMVMGLIVVRKNGRPPTIASAYYRNFGKLVSALPLWWGFIRLLTPSFRQGIHDELARCFVIER